MVSLFIVKVFSSLLLFFSEPVTISKNTLIHLKCINELSTTLPKDIKAYTLTVVGKKDGNWIVYGSDEVVELNTIIPNGCDVEQEVRDFLSKVDIGHKVYFDFKYLRTNEAFPKLATFGFMVTE